MIECIRKWWGLARRKNDIRQSLVRKTQLVVEERRIGEDYMRMRVLVRLCRCEINTRHGGVAHAKRVHLVLAIVGLLFRRVGETGQSRAIRGRRQWRQVGRVGRKLRRRVRNGWVGSLWRVGSIVRIGSVCRVRERWRRCRELAGVLMSKHGAFVGGLQVLLLGYVGGCFS